jgi:hypothetical protein
MEFLATSLPYTHACPSLAQTCTFRLEVEDDGVLARLQLRPFPNRALEIEQVIEEHYFASTDFEGYAWTLAL